MKVETREAQVGHGEPAEGADGPPAATPHRVRLNFEIKDTGVGIAPDEMDKVFEAFVQTSSGQRSQQGTGLGLPISREYVRMMGGDLTVQSKVGVGSVFAFDVQVEVVDAVMMARTRPVYHIVGLEPGQPIYRILIVEDDNATRQLLVKFLTPLGFDIKEAHNGAEAVALWASWQPHLIFMDMRMPVMDGHAATREIKARSESQKPTVKTVIIALTASAFEEERDSFLAAGCSDFVRKPFREATLIEILVRHLGVRFIYETPDSPKALKSEARHPPQDLEKITTQLKVIAPEWKHALQQATVEGDLKWMEALVTEISDEAPELAGQLAQLLYHFEHDDILRLLQADNEVQKT